MPVVRRDNVQWTGVFQGNSVLGGIQEFGVFSDWWSGCSCVESEESPCVDAFHSAAPLVVHCLKFATLTSFLFLC